MAVEATDPCPHMGDRKVAICKITNEFTEMVYEGGDVNHNNGHPGWLCLHNDNKED